MKPIRCVCLTSLLACASALAAEQVSWWFDLATAECRAEYTDERGHGMESGSNGARFSVAVPEGNYRVTATIGADSEITIKAESRRLMIERLMTMRDAELRCSFIVNVRNHRIPAPEKNAPGGDRVVLKERERGALHWDDKLTLEFVGPRPAVREVLVERVTVPTVFLLGDSTVTDQPLEPNASWGQMLPRFFKPDIAVANHAESGETLKSFISGLRLAKVLSQLKEGDWVFMQFGHNDSKTQWPQTYADAQTTYKAYLRAFVAEVRLRGATPVLVTSVHRRVFDGEGRIVNTHGEYPAAVRALAQETGVHLIDLESMSRGFYEALGPTRAELAFADGGRDKTHHNNYGAYVLARCVVQGIRDAHLDLAHHIASDFRGFNPGQPDAPELFELAPSPGPAMAERPRGD